MKYVNIRKCLNPKEILEFFDHRAAYFPDAILFVFIPYFIGLRVLGSQLANRNLEFTHLGFDDFELFLKIVDLKSRKDGC